MTDTPHEQQPREPGVRYRRETRWRTVATVIDGVPSTHEEPYYVDVPVPPKDWDDVIVRGVTGLAVVVTVFAFVGTSASVGGLLDRTLNPVIAYGLGLVYTASWLGCLGLEWVEGRVDPDRAKPARLAGWAALAISMGAVFIYGHTLGHSWAGAAGACIDLWAKGLWKLLMKRHEVRLPKGVANWVVHQEQKAAGLAIVTDRIRRLNRRAAYSRAVGGREYQAAQAALTAESTAALPRPDTSGQPAPAPARPAAPPLSGQDPAPVSGHVPDPAGPPPVVPSSPPVPSAPSVPPPAAPAPPAPPVVPAGLGASGSSGQPVGGPTLHTVGPLSIAAAVRQARTEDPKQSDADMAARVKELRGGDDGGDPVKFAETVRRTRQRQESKEAHAKTTKTRSAP
ncbi:hypothetical protein ACFVH9_08480 [Streptomyces hirsutus]|uniref:hypothetical protein n=1 Tax=Streptomyces hirsutus TaxID=35620 RepID=UPI003629C319